MPQHVACTRARARAREVLQRRYVQVVSPALRLVRKRYTQAVPFAVTPQHRAPQHEPQNRSRSLRALRTPVVTASRQARDNENTDISSSHRHAKTQRAKKDNNIHREIGAHIRRKKKNTSVLINGRARNGYNRQHTWPGEKVEHAAIK